MEWNRSAHRRSLRGTSTLDSASDFLHSWGWGLVFPESPSLHEDVSRVTCYPSTSTRYGEAHGSRSLSNLHERSSELREGSQGSRRLGLPFSVPEYSENPKVFGSHYGQGRIEDVSWSLDPIVCDVLCLTKQFLNRCRFIKPLYIF